jgi:hypothetical protein
MCEDLKARGEISSGSGILSAEQIYAYTLGRSPRKTLYLGDAQESNVQVLQLSGKMVQDDKQRVRVSLLSLCICHLLAGPAVLS